MNVGKTTPGCLIQEGRGILAQLAEHERRRLTEHRNRSELEVEEHGDGNGDNDRQAGGDRAADQIAGSWWDYLATGARLHRWWMPVEAAGSVAYAFPGVLAIVLALCQDLSTPEKAVDALFTARERFSAGSTLYAEVEKIYGEVHGSLVTDDLKKQREKKAAERRAHASTWVHQSR